MLPLHVFGIAFKVIFTGVSFDSVYGDLRMYFYAEGRTDSVDDTYSVEYAFQNVCSMDFPLASKADPLTERNNSWKMAIAAAFFVVTGCIGCLALVVYRKCRSYGNYVRELEKDLKSQKDNEIHFQLRMDEMQRELKVLGRQLKMDFHVQNEMNLLLEERKKEILYLQLLLQSKDLLIKQKEEREVELRSYFQIMVREGEKEISSLQCLLASKDLSIKQREEQQMEQRSYFQQKIDEKEKETEKLQDQIVKEKDMMGRLERQLENASEQQNGMNLLLEERKEEITSLQHLLLEKDLLIKQKEVQEAELRSHFQQLMDEEKELKGILQPQEDQQQQDQLKRTKTPDQGHVEDMFNVIRNKKERQWLDYRRATYDGKGILKRNWI